MSNLGKHVLTTRDEVEAIVGPGLGVGFKKGDYSEAELPIEYKLREPEDRWLKCCFIPDDRDHRCKKGHKHGFILELKDGNKGLIGNVCISENFEDSEVVRKATSFVRNQNKRLEILAKAKEILGDTDKVLRSIEEADLKLYEIVSFVRQFENVLGDDVFYRISPHTNETGEFRVQVAEIDERWTFWSQGDSFDLEEPHKFVRSYRKVGTIKYLQSVVGSAVFQKRSYEAARDQVIPYISGEGDVEEGKLKKLPALYDSLKQAIVRVNNLFERYEKFKSNNFETLCLLTSNTERRIEIVRWARGIKGKSISREESLSLINKIDEKLLHLTGAHHINHNG